MGVLAGGEAQDRKRSKFNTLSRITTAQPWIPKQGTQHVAKNRKSEQCDKSLPVLIHESFSTTQALTIDQTLDMRYSFIRFYTLATARHDGRGFI